MEKVITGLLVLVGIIHLLPVFGVLGVERLAALYGISLGEPNIEILMRHRAILFGLLGLFFGLRSLPAIAANTGNHRGPGQCCVLHRYCVVSWRLQ